MLLTRSASYVLVAQHSWELCRSQAASTLCRQVEGGEAEDASLDEGPLQRGAVYMYALPCMDTE
jgi:hypothetical protein